MKILIKLTSLLVIILASAVARDFDQSMLVGTWGDSEDGGETFWAYNKYTGDGKLISWGKIPGAGISYEITSEYEIEKRDEENYSCITITGTSDPNVMPVGYNWCDKVVEVTNSEFTYMNDEGKTFTMYKQ